MGTLLKDVLQKHMDEKTVVRVKIKGEQYTNWGKITSLDDNGFILTNSKQDGWLQFDCVASVSPAPDMVGK